MTENRVVALRQKGAIDDPLTEILRTGARRLIAQAVETEFETFLASTAELVLPGGRQRVVRHGHDEARFVGAPLRLRLGGRRLFAGAHGAAGRMKGALSQDTARLMAFKLVMAASRTWQCLKGQNQLPKVVNGIKFKDGIETVAEIKSAA
jgi:hypothetical protein